MKIIFFMFAFVGFCMIFSEENSEGMRNSMLVITVVSLLLLFASFLS